jgi:hypothetical protein
VHVLISHSRCSSEFSPALHISFTDRKGKRPNTTSAFTAVIYLSKIYETLQPVRPSAVAVTEVYV